MNAEHLLDRASAVVGHRRGIYGAPDSVFDPDSPDESNVW
jgi:hypothetical protein